MSVDKIAPLPASPVDPVMMKSAEHGRMPPAPDSPASQRTAAAQAPAFQKSASTAVSEPLLPQYENLSLPALAAIALKNDERQAPARLVAAFSAPALSAYAAAKASPDDSPPLTQGRLPQDAVNRAALSALKETAAAQGKALPQFLATMNPIDHAKLPSLNSAGAQFQIHSTLLASDETGAPIKLDLFVAKSAPNILEVAIFNREDASMRGQFPYFAPPISVDRLAVDPSTGQIMASVAQFALPMALRSEAREARRLLSVTEFAKGVIALASIILGLVFAAKGSLFVAVAVVGAGVYGARRWRL